MHIPNPKPQFHIHALRNQALLIEAHLPLCQFWFDNDLPAQVDRLQRKLAEATAKNATLSRIESEQRQAIASRDQQLRQRDEQAAELRAQLGEREQEAAAALAELDRARDRLAEEVAAMNEDRRAQLVSHPLHLCLNAHPPLHAFDSRTLR